MRAAMRATNTTPDDGSRTIVSDKVTRVGALAVEHALAGAVGRTETLTCRKIRVVRDEIHEIIGEIIQITPAPLDDGENEALHETDGKRAREGSDGTQSPPHDLKIRRISGCRAIKIKDHFDNDLFPICPHQEQPGRVHHQLPGREIRVPESAPIHRQFPVPHLVPRQHGVVPPSDRSPSPAEDVRFFPTGSFWPGTSTSAGKSKLCQTVLLAWSSKTKLPDSRSRIDEIDEERLRDADQTGRPASSNRSRPFDVRRSSEELETGLLRFADQTMVLEGTWETRRWKDLDSGLGVAIRAWKVLFGEARKAPEVSTKRR
ncbi:major heat shock 70 kDa protein Ba [Striga asiatica]|uniref:Major heat shock 70 kDa protein Ba n=1 Tax=Striga asiatica TaxID=4170 RepID=A0A5A7QWH7_STRAF|nr:major heat shock 70 kDa protein Ba [Striga asiatica]